MDKAFWASHGGLQKCLCARASTNEQLTLATQNRAIREYAARRGRRIALQVRDVSSGAVPREAREEVLEATRRREIDLVLVLPSEPVGAVRRGFRRCRW